MKLKGIFQSMIRTLVAVNHMTSACHLISFYSFILTKLKMKPYLLKRKKMLDNWGREKLFEYS